METKEINEIITKLENEFNIIEKANPRERKCSWKLGLITDRYYYVNCRLRDILTCEEELREAYYQVYLKLFSIYLKRSIKKNNGGLLLEIHHLCWAINHKNDFFIEDCCSKEGIFWVVKYHNTSRYLTKKYSYYGHDMYREPSEYLDEVLKEAVKLVHDIVGKQFDEQVYKDKILLEQPTEKGWQKLVMYCLDYFQEGNIKDELYLECVLS